MIGILASIGYIIWTGLFGFTKVDDVTGSITGNYQTQVVKSYLELFQLQIAAVYADSL